MPSIKLSASVPEEKWSQLVAHFEGAGTSQIIHKAIDALMRQEGVEDMVPIYVPVSKVSDVQEFLSEER